MCHGQDMVCGHVMVLPPQITTHPHIDPQEYPIWVNHGYRLVLFVPMVQINIQHMHRLTRKSWQCGEA